MSDAICRHAVTVVREGRERCAICEAVILPPAPPAQGEAPAATSEATPPEAPTLDGMRLLTRRPCLLHAGEHTVEECLALSRLALSEERREAAVREAEERFDCRRGPGWSSEEPPCGACATCLTRSLEAAERERDEWRQTCADRAEIVKRDLAAAEAEVAALRSEGEGLAKALREMIVAPVGPSTVVIDTAREKARAALSAFESRAKGGGR